MDDEKEFNLGIGNKQLVLFSSSVLVVGGVREGGEVIEGEGKVEVEFPELLHEVLVAKIRIFYEKEDKSILSFHRNRPHNQSSHALMAEKDQECNWVRFGVKL